MFSWVRKLFTNSRFYLLSILVISTLCYLTVLISPKQFWMVSLVSYGIPVMLIINLVSLIILSFANRKYVIYPIAGLLFGFSFISESFSWNSISDNSNSIQKLSVLSYNVKLFREYNVYNKFSSNLISWVVNDTSDIKCLQEFSTNKIWTELNTSLKIRSKGYSGYEYAANLKDRDHNPGMAIFSKLPILNQGMVWKEASTMNGGMYIDVLKGNDTLRIYNVHLASMYLDLSHFKERTNVLSKINYLITQLKSGTIKRSEQIELLINHTSNCKTPYIIVGDFNETPYGFNYKSLSEQYKSSFNSAGTGFGFSFNGLLFFLRIDHHFYNPKIHAHKYEVDRSIKISDHFPTRAWYSLY